MTPANALLVTVCGALWVAATVVYVRHAILRPPSARFLVAAYGVFTAGVLALAIVTSDRHDYVHFLEQWRNTLSGGDPWDQSLGGENPGYGPLFNVFAPLIRIHPLVPKILFAGVYLAVALWSTALYVGDEASRAFAPLVLAYFVFTPYFWVEVPVYGHFDVVPAAATLLAAHFAIRRRSALSGVALAVGTLLKTIPVVALPFIVAWSMRRVRLVVAFAVTSALVFSISLAIWGSRTVTALVLPADRSSNLFSIFTFLRGDYSPLRLVADHPDVDGASLPLLLVAGALLVGFFARRRTHVVVVITLAFVIVFALYKLGHPQFQMVVFVLLPYLFLTLSPDRVPVPLFATTLVYVMWFSVLDVVYAVGGQLRRPPWIELREILGLPTFVVALALAAALFPQRESPVRPVSAARLDGLLYRWRSAPEASLTRSARRPT